MVLTGTPKRHAAPDPPGPPRPHWALELARLVGLMTESQQAEYGRLHHAPPRFCLGRGRPAAQGSVRSIAS